MCIFKEVAQWFLAVRKVYCWIMRASNCDNQLVVFLGTKARLPWLSTTSGCAGQLSRKSRVWLDRTDLLFFQTLGNNNTVIYAFILLTHWTPIDDNFSSSEAWRETNYQERQFLPSDWAGDEVIEVLFCCLDPNVHLSWCCRGLHEQTLADEAGQHWRYTPACVPQWV